MNRKSFLHRAALTSLALAGLPRIGKAFQTETTIRTYYSEIPEGYPQYSYAIDISPADVLQKGTIMKLTVSYKPSDGATLEAVYEYVTAGPAKKESGYTMVDLKFKRIVEGQKNQPKDFPASPRLKITTDEEVELETSKGNYTTLTYTECFLTSACTFSKGLPDDCIELTTLRQYRDGFLWEDPEGKELIKEYYHLGPEIVNAINRCSNRKEIYDYMYGSLVLPSVNLIDNGKLAEAKEYYRDYVTSLKGVFL
jgi:hypothetical protein